MVARFHVPVVTHLVDALLVRERPGEEPDDADRFA
jgi:hypothetical protein